VDRQMAEQDMADDHVARRHRDQLRQHVAVRTQPLDQRALVRLLERAEVDRADGRDVARPRLADVDAGNGGYCAPPAAASSTSPSALAISRISLLRMA
jgi:hypothetical protein